MIYNKKPAVIDRMILNSVQRDAILYDGGPQLVFAGAGTGKTRVLTAKIAHLIEKGYRPGQLFAATFTNKAAREMRTRIEGLIDISLDGLWIGTFHSLCARMLRLECRHIGYMPSFTIYDSDDQVSIVKKVLRELDIDDRSIPPRQALGAVSRCKNACITPEEFEKQAKGYYDQEILSVYKLYQKKLREQQGMDFDDLLCNTVYLLRQKPEILQRYQEIFKYILVDEYQDTNVAQFQLIKLLSKKHGRVFAVGDDDQSIYGWRGAQVENILSFEREFPDTKIFKLEQNYRSTTAVLNFANAAIAQNLNRAQKQLWTDRQGGEQVIVNRFRDDRQEAQCVAEKILSSMNGKIAGQDIAVLYRTNAQSRAFEEAFRRARIPYVLVGGIGFYERAEIKDCLAYLRLLVNPKDSVSFERIFNVPSRGLGDKAHESLALVAQNKQCSLLEALLTCDISSLGSRAQKGFSDLKTIFELLIDLEKKGEKPHEILLQVLQLTGYMDMLTADDSEEARGRVENINELVNAMVFWKNENPSKKLFDFLEEVTLISDVDSWNKKENAVNLMTLHCAKGLEFKHVYLVGLEDGILPSRQNTDDERKIEEECRLLYVGATRAMEKLECSHVDQRWRFGDLIPSSPSRFLNAIPENLYVFRDNSNYFGQTAQRNELPSKPVRALNSSATLRTPAAPAKQQQVQRNIPQYDDFSQDTVEFRMGQHIRHKVYGRGRILSISGFGEDMKLTVLFNDGSRKKLMAKFASIE
ncbi:MAG: UvrD-helicase domain-containing protein [Fibrobacter sp.]|nr:UvrD-helicase domain-containing protein [Fibrobacter sp.]